MTRTDIYMEFLAEEGFRPKLDEDGDITFRCEGKTFLIFRSHGDEQLFRLGALWIWPIESEEERQRALVAAAETTAQLKVVKVFPMNDDIWATVELLFEEPGQVRAVFPRALALCQAGVEQFGSKMRESAVPEPIAQA
jgi:hypothetical protein